MADAQRPTPDERGTWLREARTRAGYPVQADFARAMDIDKTLLSNYETGKTRPSDESAERIAAALQLPVIEVRRRLGLWVPDGAEPAIRAARLEDVSNADLLDEIGRRLQPDNVERLRAEVAARQASRRRGTA